jgi:hypothetical protein
MLCCTGPNMSFIASHLKWRLIVKKIEIKKAVTKDITEDFNANTIKRQKVEQLLEEALHAMQDFNDELSDSEEILEYIGSAINTLNSKEDPCAIEDNSEENIELLASDDLATASSSVLLDTVKESTAKIFEKQSTSKILSTAATIDSSIFKYAPQMPTKTGTYDLYPISLSWTNDAGASVGQLNNMGGSVSSIINRLSNGAITLNVKSSRIYKTNLEKNGNAVKSQSDKAKNLYTDKDSKNIAFYAIVNNGAKSYSNSGNKVASLFNTLIVTAGHEVLHLLGLQHSARYSISTKGKNKGQLELQPSRDSTSIMSIYSSADLTAPQKYSMGWYEKKQVAMYEIGDPSIIYSLQPVCEKYSDSFINAVLIPRSAQPSLFLSMSETTDKKNIKNRALVLHTGEKGASTRLKFFTEHADIDDLSFDLVEKTDDCWKVRVGLKL